MRIIIKPFEITTSSNFRFTVTKEKGEFVYRGYNEKGEEFLIGSTRRRKDAIDIVNTIARASE